MAMRDFSRFIDDMELIDLPLHGGQYTWFRGNNEHSASRIDRFLISTQWDNSSKLLNKACYLGWNQTIVQYYWSVGNGREVKGISSSKICGLNMLIL